MSPELVVLLVNAACLGLAFGWIFPAIVAAKVSKPMRLFLEVDIALSVAALVILGSLYAGEGRAFSLLLFTLPWWAFTLVTYAAMELILWDWFRRRNDIDFDDF